jgi:TP901 family phage tail tape measure protein
MSALDVEINVFGNFGKGIENLINRTSSFGFALNNAGHLLSKFQNILDAPIDAIVEFNDEMANIESLGVNNIDQLRQSVLALAKDSATKNATTDLTQGLYNVVSAGVDASNQINVLSASSKAAKAGLATTTDALNLGSATIKAYNVGWSEFDKIMDLAFQTVKDGQTTFPELAGSMQKVLPTASAMGISMEETFATLSTLTGVTGGASEVVTGFKAALSNIAKPTQDAEIAAKKMGIEFNLAALKTKGWAGFLEEIKEKTGGNAISIKKLFGSMEGFNTVVALAGAQSDTFTKKLENMKDSAGAMQGAYDKQANTLGAKLTKLGNRFHTTLIRIGEVIEPFIKKTVDFAINHFDDFVNVAFSTISTLKDLIPVIGALAAGYAAFVLIKKATTLWQQRSIILHKLKIFWLNKETGAFKRLNTAMKANIIGFIISALIGLITWLASSSKALDGFKDLWNGLVEFFKVSIKNFGSLLSIYGRLWFGAFTFIYNLVLSFKDKISNIFSNIGDLFIAVFKGDWDKVKSSASNLFSAAGDGFSDAFKLSFQDALNDLDKIDYSKAGKSFKAGFQKIKDSLKGEEVVSVNPTINTGSNNGNSGTETGSTDPETVIQEENDLRQLKIDLMEEGFEREKALIQKRLDDELAKYKGSEEAKRLLHQKYQRELSELESRERKRKLKENLDFITNLNKLGIIGAREFAAAYKTIAIGEAVIDGFKAVQKAWASAPFPANLPAVLITGVKTAANVAGIAATKFEDGGEINKETLALLGENVGKSGPEIVVPKKIFKTVFDETVFDFKEKLQSTSQNITGAVETLQRRGLLDISRNDRAPETSDFRNGQVNNYLLTVLKISGSDSDDEIEQKVVQVLNDQISQTQTADSKNIGSIQDLVRLATRSLK